MTWSIIARDADRIGIAVATCNFAVGARVPSMRTGVGAVCAQALVNPFFGPRGLALLSAGRTAEKVVQTLMTGDDGRDHRQVHAMDRQGRFAAATGEKCVGWCGHIVRETLSVAGNMLTGADVILATADGFEAAAGLPLPERLVKAMLAGEAVGGDKRGRQSAALLVHGSEDASIVDVRVDDHADPLNELARLEVISRQRSIHARRFGPRRDDPVGILDREALEKAIQCSIAEGYR